jgi:hypothetical protein
VIACKLLGADHISSEASRMVDDGAGYEKDCEEPKTLRRDA